MQKSPKYNISVYNHQMRFDLLFTSQANGHQY